MPATEAWARLAAGTHPADPGGRHRRRAAAHQPAALAAACARAGVVVVRPGDPRYPPALAGDDEAPAVLFVAGSWARCSALPRVAVVGTRAPTVAGAAVAEALGHDLAVAGVAVVSGLARGVDAAAHGGALVAGAPVIGVLGAAHDAGAPGDTVALRQAVARHGVLLSEVPPGVPGSRWMFAVRNRIMAALADVVVVVESHRRGGSLHTVAAARQRRVPVAAVPGSVRNPAAAGTNRLLVCGEAAAVCTAADVLALLPPTALRVSPSGVSPSGASRSRGVATQAVLPMAAGPTAATRGDAALVLAALNDQPAASAVVAARAGLAPGRAAAALEALLTGGMAEEEHGWWCLGARGLRPRRAP